jgi:hypothetical protein
MNPYYFLGQKTNIAAGTPAKVSALAIKIVSDTLQQLSPSLGAVRAGLGQNVGGTPARSGPARTLLHTSFAENERCRVLRRGFFCNAVSKKTLQIAFCGDLNIFSTKGEPDDH